MLIISSKMGKMLARMPHKVLIRGQLVGILQQPSVAIELPPGVYLVTIQSMVPLLSASATVQLNYGDTKHLDFKDREGWWDILFCIDLLLWAVKWFLHLAAPWTWIYEIFTNGFFLLWLLYEWRIRNNYFKIKVW